MFRKIDEDELINLLKKHFSDERYKLYVVGGFVRECVMGIVSNRKVRDIDLCGNVSLDEILEFCIENKLGYLVLNKKLEVVKILFGENEYEYARNRKEKYKTEFSHLPSNIVFTEKIEEDVLRRDFTINAFYYNIKTKTFVDLCGGMEDVENKRVRAVLASPEETMKKDPARIIRMVELASRLGFDVEPKTLMFAKKYAKNIYKLSKARLQKELFRIEEKNKYGENYDTFFYRVNKLLCELEIGDILTK